jgi:endonuclease/exonuclease/phosphatase family metal-dependent hydrolase
VPELSVASFNVHGGVDGWGRPFDVVEACRRLDADVLVLQETWIPFGAAEGASRGVAEAAPRGTAEEVGAALGYAVTSVPVAPARRYPPPASAGRRWGPARRRRHGVGLRIDLGPRRSDRRRRGEPGAVGIALLERGRAGAAEVVELGSLGRDPARRVALRTRAPGQGQEVATVVGTHLAHIRQGSPLQLRRLGRMLPGLEERAVVAGDMNMWGPPLTLMMRGWSRAVVGRTWPSWRPLFQIDHILVTPAVRVLGAEVLPVGGSDHLPVRAELSL